MSTTTKFATRVEHVGLNDGHAPASGVDEGLASREILSRLTVRHSPAPRYFQIAEQITALIDSGDLRRGDRLPSRRATARRLAVHTSTVAQAWQYLQAVDLVAVDGLNCWVL